MAILTFTLSEEGVTAFRDALNCLSKFSEDVSIEARKDSVSNRLLKLSLRRYQLLIRRVVLPIHNEHIKVSLRELPVCDQPVFWTLPVPSHRTVSRQVLLLHVYTRKVCSLRIEFYQVSGG